MTRARAIEQAIIPQSISPWLRPGRAFFFLIGYFVLQTLFRTLISNSAELDESEQLLWTQDWRWGYGSDPPLYTWLQILVFHVFGISIFGLALLKNALMFSGFLFTYLGANLLVQDRRVASAAMLSLLLFPQVTWESQRDLTHSVLATALAAATFFMAVRAWRNRSPLDYLILGTCVGLGTLSKYSYCLVAVALCVAALTVPTFRQAVLSKWMLLALAAFLAITALHFRWMSLSSDLALSRPAEVVRSSSGPFIRARMLGLFSIVKCAVMIGGALGVVYWIAFRTARSAYRSAETLAVLQWVGGTLLVVLGICLVVVLASGIELRDRWFQPIVFLLAISAALLIRDQLTPGSERRLVSLVGALAVVALLVLPAIPLSASVTRRPTRLNSPYSTLTRQLKERISNPGVIVAANRLVGGNLRLFFPHSTVVAPEFNQFYLQENTPWLIAWDASKSAPPPPALATLVHQLRGTNLAALTPGSVEAAYKFTRARSMRLGYVRLLPAVPSLLP